MTLTDRIEVDPKVMSGKPVIRGTRIPVELLLRKLSEGSTEEALLHAYPSLTRRDIRAAVHFANRGRTARAGARRKTIPRARIKQMVRLIVERFGPEKVILFGSHARGDAGPDSDVDLLVVMPVTGSKRDRQIEIRAALREFEFPKDVIVTTPEDFAWRSQIPGTIERPAAREGIILYARA